MAVSLTFIIVVFLIGSCQCHDDDIFADDDVYATNSTGCTAPGSFLCSADCSSLAYCRPVGEDNELVVIETCRNGSLCNSASHACEEGIECIVPPDPADFKCYGTGYFPDPYACETYHLCGTTPGETPILTEKCPTPSAYNPLTTQCTLTAQDRVCVDKPIDTCLAPGQLGPQIENPNIYYICVKENNVLLPRLYKCPTNQIFVGTRCVLTV